jgi:Fe-Mn family superoxide dismutase
MKAKGGGQPTGRLLDMIIDDFGTFEAFKNAFVTAGIGQFGSGWVWLIQDNETVRIIKSSNADTPEAHGRNALLTCDVWEHAYYLDYQNRRKDYLTAFLDNLANWEFASSRLN